MNQYTLLNNMIGVYETHLEAVDGDYWWGSEFEIALQNQVNQLFQFLEIKTEDEILMALDRATQEEMVEYWKEWLEKVKWEVNEKAVEELKVCEQYM